MTKDAFTTTKLGISQYERWFDSLMPEFVEIDSRDITDFLKFTTKLSSQINFYNQSNNIKDTWSDFLVRDANILALMVSKFSISEIINTFNQLHKAIGSAATREDRLECLAKLFFFITTHGSGILELKKQFTNINIQNQIEEIQSNLPDVERELQQLFQFFNEVTLELGSNFENNHKRPLFFEDRAISSSQFFFKTKTYSQNFSFALNELVKIFDQLNAKMHKLIKATQVYIEHNKFTEQQYPPQIGLFLTFLDLYSHLKSKINGINRRHLDLYYKQILGFDLKNGSPDQVLLIIEPDQSIQNALISINDLLLAEIKGNDPILYQLKSELQLTKIRVSALRTIYKSQLIQIEGNLSGTFDIKSTPVFQSSHPTFNPATYLKNPESIESWAALGEEQESLDGNMRTMEYAELALVIGSPLFYLTEGERVINIKVYFKPESYYSLINYIKNYNKLTEANINTTLYHLLSEAFRIKYTSNTNWEEIKNFSVILNYKTNDIKDSNINFEEQFIEIIIRLNESEPSFNKYSKAIHQLPFDSELPLLRIELNNYAEHHPYSFFNNTLIERVTIKTSVKGFQSIALQNNIGVLSTASPFQIFGPQPSIGSFLDIKNTNIFNCFTKNIAIHLEWMDLPLDKGGFTTYYKGYGAPFANDSYLAGISSLNNGIFLPDAEKQQMISLFTINNENDTLQPQTSINAIDFNKIKFLNRPLLDIDNEQPITEGTLRLTLSSPQEAFGQKLYPKIFPEIVLNNAKMFSKKLALPNLPIIPLIKTISIDYTLEYSENFLDENSNSNLNIELFHLNPFGFEQAYPGNRKKNIHFMPNIADNKNLLIGLENSFPLAELNLLFQFEDSGAHHTLHEPETISWKYLDNNNWIDFPQRDQIFDSTNNFINSGIVKLRLPKDQPAGNTILNPDLFWIKASSGLNHAINSRIIAISNNGTTAIRIIENSVDELQNLSLAPGTITDFKTSKKGIQQVWQPFSSNKGKIAEESEKFYVRVSERIRHKQRPVQFNDIIQVVLEEFPEILTIKCFNTATENFMVVPNINLQLVLIPKESDSGRFINKQPRVSLATLHSVKNYLHKIISPFVSIEVGNPIYEKVKIICKVMFTKKAAVNSGYYLSLLTSEINNFIAPWLYKEKEDVRIGDCLYKSDILLFIKKREYVDYVSGFSVVHFSKIKDTFTNELNAKITDTVIDKSEFIIGSSPATVFIPSTDHIITLINQPEFEPETAAGIGSFIIGDELLVSELEHKEDIQNTSQNCETEDDDDYFSLIITQNI